MIPELYVLVITDDEGNIVGYPKGGGSSTSPRVKAYDSRISANRGRGQMVDVEIAKITGLEIVD